MYIRLSKVSSWLKKLREYYLGTKGFILVTLMLALAEIPIISGWLFDNCSGIITLTYTFILFLISMIHGYIGIFSKLPKLKESDDRTRQNEEKMK